MRISLAQDRDLVLLTGDITRQTVDAIVNAANSSLMGGGGVDGAIHRAGGSAILEACKEYRKTHPPLPPGQAIATTAGNLAAKYVIHTVGPIWNGGGSGEAETLASCYRESIRVADELELKTIAFPAISTGAYGYPISLAAPVAIGAVIKAMTHYHHVREVRFILFDQRTLTFYSEVLDRVNQ